VSSLLDEHFARTIFFGLLLAQDRGLSVTASRETVAARWGLTIDQPTEVEGAGINGPWPPLS
jgi:hypothetical protein